MDIIAPFLRGMSQELKKAKNLRKPRIVGYVDPSHLMANPVPFPLHWLVRHANEDSWLVNGAPEQEIKVSGNALKYSTLWIQNNNILEQPS